MITMNYVTFDDNKQYLKYIILPTGDTVHFDEVTECIDISRVRPYSGHVVEYLRDGVFVDFYRILRIDGEKMEMSRIGVVSNPSSGALPHPLEIKGKCSDDFLKLLERKVRPV